MMTTINIDSLYRKTIEYFKEKNIENPNIDARYLIEDFFDMSNSVFYMSFSKKVSEEEYRDFWKLVEKRGTHYPLQYIIGTQEFMGLNFDVNENVLIPRQETELLVEEVFEICKTKNNDITVIDMCTGSGCIAISLYKMCEQINKNINIMGVDISKEALEVAKENASKNNANVKFVESNLFENVEGEYDVLVSNPPYIRTKDIEALMKEVKNFEPFIALDGLEDGLYFYKKIIENAKNYLKKDAYLCFEIGYNQAKDVCNLLSLANYCDIEVVKDYAGLDRIVKAKKI